MDAASNYFISGYDDDTAETRRALDAVAEALRVFEDGFVESISGWPYRMSQTPAKEHQAQFSMSTNAMIAYALLGATGYVRQSVLLPLSRPVEVPSRLKGLAGGKLKKLLTKTLRTTAKQLRLKGVRSSTFGSNDPFTLTWLIEAHRSLAESRDASLLTALGSVAPLSRRARGVLKKAERRKDGMILSVPSPKNGVPHAFEVPHPFPLLRAAQLAKALDRLSKPGRQTDITWMRSIFLDRLRRNLSDNIITDSQFDAADLVFSLEGMLIAGATPDEPMTETVFEVLRESQNRNEYWRPVRPFIASFQGHTLLPLSIEVANSLLRICDHLDREFPERSFFSENLPLFKRYAQWLRARTVTVVKNETQYSAWHSENTMSENTIDLWETSQVIVFLLLYSDLLKRHVARETLRASRLHLSGTAARRDSVSEWQKSSDLKEPMLGAPPGRQVYRQIGTFFVEPRAKAGATKQSHSMLLYGPPGTGKTSIAEDLASALGQKLITITPSDFLAEGPNEVEARAKVIFRALQAQADCVVLLDEIDRLILDRDSLMYHKQSDAFQFMTPSMLVKLKELRSASQIIFIIGTNYYERVDPAARRIGRIDHRFFVAPPNRERRRAIILTRIQEESTPTRPIPRPSGKRFDEALDLTALFTYGELKTLVRETVGALPVTNGATLAGRLCQLAREGDPAIRVGMYSNRMQPEGGATEFDAAQKPVDEYLAVLDLLEEANRLGEASDATNTLQALVDESGRHSDHAQRAARLLRTIKRAQRGASRASEAATPAGRPRRSRRGQRL